MQPDANTASHKVAWWVLAFVGVVLTVGGLFGVWLQGVVYERGFPTPATVDEIRAAFTLPTAVTTAGSLVVSGVILGSPLTASWSATRRLVLLLGFSALVLAACVVCGHLAGSRVAPILN